MKRGKFAKYLAIAMALCLCISMLAACGGGEEEEAPAEDGGLDVLNVTIASEPNSIDPALNTAVDGGTLINHAFEGLTKINDKQEVVNGQAADYTVSEDGTVYTFTLRDDIKWSDGEPVTAQDFVYGWKRLINPETAAEYSYMIDMVKGAKDVIYAEDPAAVTPEMIDALGIVAKDEKTLEVTLDVACPYFLEICAFPAAYPVRQDVVEASAAWANEATTYIGNGPYKLTDWSHQSYMLYEQNENYYGVAELGPKAIKFMLMDDHNTMLAAYRNNELSFADECPVEECDAMAASGDLYITPQMGTYFVCFNTQKAPFDDVRVRKAFNLAIDRGYIIDQVSQGEETPAPAYVPFGMTDVNTGEDFRELGGTFYKADAADYEANCAEAKQLLADAGYPEGAGFPQVEYMYNTSDQHKAIGEALQFMWKDVLGVNVTMVNQDWNVFIESRQNGDYEIARHGWLADYNDPISFLDMWVTGSGNNDADWSNAEYDSLISDVKGSADREERMTKMHEAEALLMEDMPIAPIFFYTDKYLLKSDVKGFYTNPLGFKYFMYVSIGE